MAGMIEIPRAHIYLVYYAPNLKFESDDRRDPTACVNHLLSPPFIHVEIVVQFVPMMDESCRRSGASPCLTLDHWPE